MNVEGILNDGIIDAEEVKVLREDLYADGVIEREEVEALFAMKDAASEYCDEFKELLVEATRDCLMEDGIIDEEEKIWLRDLIMADGVIDELEQEILELIGE